MDKDRAMKATRELLLALDQNVESDGLRDTPKRVAEMFIEQCTGSEAGLDRLFEETMDEMVMLRDIPFTSCCMHHLVFYTGKAHVAYIPHKRVLGLSKLARLINACSKGFTIQEAVTRTIADRLYHEVDPKGCMVVIEAAHGCMNLRGVRSLGSSTVTSCVRGVFRDVIGARQEFLMLLSKGGPR